jgi:hypothetical protein
LLELQRLTGLFLGDSLSKTTSGRERLDQERPAGRGGHDPRLVQRVFKTTLEPGKHPGQDPNTNSVSDPCLESRDRRLRNTRACGQRSLTEPPLSSKDPENVPELSQGVLAERVQSRDHISHGGMI